MNVELQDLLRSPREDLDSELKRWMDPADKVVQAKLAKELLALRNHGGGYLVIGFKDEHPPIPDPAAVAAGWSNPGSVALRGLPSISRCVLTISVARCNGHS